MKGHNAASHSPAKRRWTCLAVAAAVIIFLSVVGTGSVLLGLHNGYGSEVGFKTGSRFYNGGRIGGGVDILENKEQDEKKIDEIIDKFKPSFPQEIISNITDKDAVDFPKADNYPKEIISDYNSPPKDATSRTRPENFYTKGQPKSEGTSLETSSVPNSKDGGNDKKKKIPKGSKEDAAQKSCQLEYGSYCLWSTEHKGATNDTVVKRMKDQLFVARAYFPIIAKLKGKEKLSQEMKQIIQEYEHVFVEATSDPELPPLDSKKIEKMDQTIAKAKSSTSDCNNVDKKLRQLLDLTEDEVHFHMKQSAFLHHLGVQTMPKSHHCLSMRLTAEYFRVPPANIDQSHAHKLDNPSYQQYIIFSKNVLATSVAINSTVMNSQDSGNMVFNVITDKENFFAMKLWFSRNSYKEAVVHAMNIEDLDLGQSRLWPSEEFRVSVRADDKPSLSQIKTKYISLFGHSHFLLPDIFKNLKKVVVLDDDVVVQKDLSSLWDMDLDGKINGAVKFCGVRLGQLKYNLEINQNNDSCAWMSGLNVIDLDKWRELNITRKYQRVLPMFDSENETLWRAASLPTSFLAFQEQIFPLDDSWVLSGLGYDYKISRNAIKKAGVLHYNGNMKPWLDLGIPRYKSYWRKYLTKGELFMEQCNLNR